MTVRCALVPVLALAACVREVTLQGACPVVLNELLTDGLCADPVDTGTEEHPALCEGEQPSPDWIELLNRIDDEVDLCGWRLQSDAYEFSWEFCGDGQQYVDCDGAEVVREPRIGLTGHGLLVVVTDNRAAFGPHHTNFDLPNRGGQLQLFDDGERLCDEVTYPDLHFDEAYARPPGGGRFRRTHVPTRGAVNVIVED